MEDIIKFDLKEEIEQSFLDYSLSVITDRAIPAVEDGLKPVQRRILWTMLEDGFTSNKQFVKCASPVGDTMSKYHPHGDSSIYGSLVMMSQPWNMRYPLITFHGNNGSRDGDSPAAPRYTECKLSKIAEATLEGVKEQVVDFLPNYSETMEEPKYLPGKFPNLLCNGTSGIAVAVACNFAPHNLTEVLDAIIYRIQNEKCQVEDLLKFIQGPDFPTGAEIINKEELPAIYKTGKGRARIRAEYKIEKNLIIFTSIPFKVSKENLAVDINKLCEEGKIEGITEIRDESTKDGVRFVVETSKAAAIPAIVNKLFALTNLETTFSCNQVALVDKAPKLLNLKEIIDLYIKHQLQVLTKKVENDLQKTSGKLHIAEGVLKALEDIDKIIQEIKKSENAADAKKNLIRIWSFSELQAQAILDMKISKLAHIEKISVENTIKEYKISIDNFNRILSNLQVKKEVLIKSLQDFKNSFGDKRLTKIIQAAPAKDKKEAEMIEPEEVVVVITENNTIKRIPTKSFTPQRRNTKGVKTQDSLTKDIIKTNTVDKLVVFSSLGRMHSLLIDKIPEGTNTSKGVSLNNLIALEPNEKVLQVSSLYNETSAKFIVFITKNGTIKKTNIEEYKDFTKSVVSSIKLRDKDEVSYITFLLDEELLILTKKGRIIRFSSLEVKETGKNTIGVKAIDLIDGDEVITAKPIKHKTDSLAVFFEDGSGKKISLDEIISQKRGGKGSACTGGNIADASLIDKSDSLLIVGKQRCLCVSSEEITLKTLKSSPVQIIKNDRILSMSKI